MFPGLPKLNPGLELANAFSVKLFLIVIAPRCNNPGLKLANGFD
jgi:hypothetical protein